VPGNVKITLVDAGSKIYGTGSSGLYVSSDRGATWSLVNNFPVTPTQAVTAGLTFNSRLYLATDSGVIISPDGGSTWSNTGPFTYQDIMNSIFVLNGEVYASSTFFVYKLDTLSNTWPQVAYAPAGLQLGQGVVQGNKAFFATGNGSVWYYAPQMGLDVQDVASGWLRLYPNPADKIFTINSPELMQQIRIIDAQGREIKRLVPQNPATVQLDVSLLSAGYYLVEVKTGKAITTRSLVIGR
jgi:hypothetical protein